MPCQRPAHMAFLLAAARLYARALRLPLPTACAHDGGGAYALELLTRLQVSKLIDLLVLLLRMQFVV